MPRPSILIKYLLLFDDVRTTAHAIPEVFRPNDVGFNVNERRTAERRSPSRYLASKFSMNANAHCAAGMSSVVVVLASSAVPQYVVSPPRLNSVASSLQSRRL